MTKILKKVFSIENNNYHKVINVLGIRIKFANRVNYFKYNRDKYEMFYKRNFLRNVLVQTKPLRIEHKKKIPFHLEDEIKAIYLAKEKLNYFLLNRINIPQIEFTLTTKCTLKCKDCANFIPYVKPEEHSIIEFTDFKEDIDNLCGAVNNIYNLFLLGGEPLLLKDLYKYLEYSSSKKNIKKVWIFTNGTIPFNEELLKSIKKYHKKVIIFLSDYSINTEIQDKFKYEKIIQQVKPTKAELLFNKNLVWDFVSNMDYVPRTKECSIQYYKRCLHPCASVCDNIIFPCPRAGIYYLKHLITCDEAGNNEYNLGGREFVSLKNSNHKNLKKQIFEFYCNNYYKACNFCSRVEDQLKPQIKPGVQIK